MPTLSHSAKLARRRALSLIELMAAVAVLGVIAAVIAVRFGGYLTDNHQNACYVNQGEIAIQAQRWFRNQGTWPSANLGTFSTNRQYFPDGHLPTCPRGGTYTFNSATGKVTCSQHP